MPIERANYLELWVNMAHRLWSSLGRRGKLGYFRRAIAELEEPGLHAATPENLQKKGRLLYTYATLCEPSTSNEIDEREQMLEEALRLGSVLIEGSSPALAADLLADVYKYMYFFGWKTGTQVGNWHNALAARQLALEHQPSVERVCALLATSKHRVISLFELSQRLRGHQIEEIALAIEGAITLARNSMDIVGHDNDIYSALVLAYNAKATALHYAKEHEQALAAITEGLELGAQQRQKGIEIDLSPLHSTASWILRSLDRWPEAATHLEHIIEGTWKWFERNVMTHSRFAKSSFSHLDIEILELENCAAAMSDAALLARCSDLRKEAERMLASVPDDGLRRSLSTIDYRKREIRSKTLMSKAWDVNAGDDVFRFLEQTLQSDIDELELYADCLNARGDSWTLLGDWNRAEPYYELALQMDERWLVEFNKDRWNN